MTVSAVSPSSIAKYAVAHPASDSHAVTPTTQKAFEKLYQQLRRDHPFLPSTFATTKALISDRVVERSMFKGECFGFGIFGLSRAEREQAVPLLSEKLAQHRLPLTIVDAQKMLIIHPAGVSKGTALVTFANEIGIPEDQIIKFGDSAGRWGNDRTLLKDERSYNVGHAPAFHEGVKNVVPHGPDGVLATLEQLQRTGSPIRAIATDFDETLTTWPDGQDQPGKLDPRVARKFVELLKQGTKIAIISGRDGSFFRDCLPPLYEAGLTEQLGRNLVFYLYNGARRIRQNEWPTFARSSNR